MLQLAPFILAVAAATGTVLADEITATVYNPADVYPTSYSKEYAGKPVIYDFVKPLILEMQKVQDSDFIVSSDAEAGREWRLQHFIIVSGDIVTVRFSEGHADVAGVFVRNIKEKRWDVTTEKGGRFKFRAFDEITGEPTAVKTRQDNPLPAPQLSPK